MTEAKVYVLDANVFITASKGYYAFDLAPRFWEILVDLADKGRIESIDRIKDELSHQDDELRNWIKGPFSNAFISTDQEDVVKSYRETMNLVAKQSQYKDAAKAEYAGCADAWLVAYAMAKDRIIVTHELSSPDAKRKVKIPDVCMAFSVTFCDSFVMLRTLGIKLT